MLAILVGSGGYAPFTVTKQLQTVAAAPGATPQVTGAPGVQDVVRVSAAGATLRGLSVSGCVPRSDPAGGFDVNGSSVVRIDAGADGVTVRT